MNTCSVNFFLDGFPCRVGDGTCGVVRFDLIIRESIDQILLPQVFEEILLTPALEHAMSNNKGAELPATCHNRRLMAGLCQAGHLTESQLSFAKATGLVIEQALDRPTLQLGLASSES